MPYNNKSLVKSGDGIVAPQVYNPNTDAYEVLQGSNGAINVNMLNGNVTLGDQQAKTTTATLQNNVTTTGTGTPFTVGAYKTLTIEITGTSTSQNINFEASSISGTYYPIQGVRLSDYSMATSTTGINEVWTFDITGLQNFRANLTSVSGGNVTIQGKAVA